MSFGDDRPSDPARQFPANPYASPEGVDSRSEHTAPGDLTINPWLGILNQPRRTIRAIVDVDPERHVLLISALMGIVGLLGINDGTDESANLELMYLLPIAFFAGPIVGILLVWLVGVIYQWSARALGGVATYAEMRAAYAWSAVPSLYSIPIVLLTAVSLSPEVKPTLGDGIVAIIALSAICSLVVGIWSFVILLNTIAEVSRFSRWKAFGTMLLPGIIAAVVALVILAMVFAISNA